MLTRDQALLSSLDPARFGSHDGRHLLVAGRQDHLVGWQDQLELLEHYPRMTYAAVDGAGHNVHLDQPAVVHGLLGGWLDAHGEDHKHRCAACGSEAVRRAGIRTGWRRGDGAEVDRPAKAKRTESELRESTCTS
jgi:hypothetical protein